MNMPYAPILMGALFAAASCLRLGAAAPSVSADPPPAATVRQLTKITVTFDEPVGGVDAADLLINHVPARQVTGADAGPYTFLFDRPATNSVQVSFAPDHGIHSAAAPTIAFDGAAWGYAVNPALPTDIAVSHVVHLSLDGLGAKYLENYVSNAPAQFPNFVRLMRESAFTMNARCDYDISETIPNHITMFTGRPVFQPAGHSDAIHHHGYNNNFPGAADTIHNSGNTNLPYKASMFDVAHDHGRSTAFYAGKTRLGICDRSYDVLNGAFDLIGEDDGRDKIDFSLVADISGTAISNQVNTVIADLSSAAAKQYSFIHIAEPDLTGHSRNWGSASWSNAVRIVDAQVGRIIDAIDANPILFNRTALIVTADHGGGGVRANAHTEAYHILNYTVPFFVRAPGIPAGADLYRLFANRADPGTNRTDYATEPQPIRNGDGSNLALALMGLPPIPGSFMRPVFTPPAISLRIESVDGQQSLVWSDPLEVYALEACDTLGTAQQWQTINEGIFTRGPDKTFALTGARAGPFRYFRLARY